MVSTYMYIHVVFKLDMAVLRKFLTNAHIVHTLVSVDIDLCTSNHSRKERVITVSPGLYFLWHKKKISSV